MPAQSPPLLAGRYRVLSRLGSGGMATVYLAEDVRLGRRVAVKRMHAHSPEDVARRFEREARLGASLSHPNLVAVYDTVTDDEGVLIVMEYVEGPTLAQALEGGRLDDEKALDVVRGIAAALDHAHRQGIVHRDVKPANVILRPDGTAKLTDLGIASASEHAPITRTGALLGTPSYMAPEQLEGRRVGPATDVYALAAVAFEAFGGRKARDGRTPIEIAHRAATEPVPDLRETWPEAPPALAMALARAMAADPAERPRSAGALAEEVSRALEPEPAAPEAPAEGTAPTADAAAAATARVPETAAPPPERRQTRNRSAPPRGAAARPQRRAPASTRRRRGGVIVAAGAIALAGLAAGAIALSGGGPQPAPEPEPAGQAQRPAPDQPAERPAEPEPDPPSGDGGAAPEPDDEEAQGRDSGSEPEEDAGEGGQESEPASGPAGSPEDAVRAFYTRAVADDFAGAWELVSPAGKEQFGSQQGLENTLDTLEQIEFERLEATEESNDSATVAIQTVATHADFVDRCEGTVATTTGEDGGWVVGPIQVGCTRES